MMTIPPFKFNFKIGLQDFESTYKQYIENDFLTIMHTDTNKTKLVNYRLKELSNFSDAINKENYELMFGILVKLANLMVNTHMTYLCQIDNILEIIIEDGNS